MAEPPALWSKMAGYGLAILVMVFIVVLICAAIIGVGRWALGAY